jgi:predicted transcriptional regulator
LEIPRRHAASPRFSSKICIQFIKLVDKDIDIELIVTRDALDATIKSEDRKDLENAVKKNLKLFKIEKPPNFAAAVTDYFFFVGFFRPDR